MVRRIAYAFAALLLAAASPHAQEAPPANDGAGETPPVPNVEATEEYQETERFIEKTQEQIDRVQRQNAARAKEIEAIADKVGAIISTMSSQGEDNSNLRSEMKVLQELLIIERETTSGLREEVDRLNSEISEIQKKHAAAELAMRENMEKQTAEYEKKLKAQQAAFDDREKKLLERIRAAEDQARVAEKRLGAALESIAGHARTNRQLVSDIDSLNAELEQLRKEVEFRRRLRAPTRLPSSGN